MSTSFVFTINWLLVLSIFGIAVGAILAGAGMLAGCDPEGRGQPIMLPLVLIGTLLFIVSVGYCLYRLGSVFGWWM